MSDKHVPYSDTGVARSARAPDEPKRGFTRRQFLMGVPLGIAGAAALTVVSGRFVSAFVRRRRRTPNLPQDSIFAPDRSRYPEA